jgi:hypothetical protein
MAWFSPNGNELRHHAALNSVTLTSNLLKNLGGVVTTLGPLSLKVIGKLLYLGWFSDRLLALPSSFESAAAESLPFESVLHGGN